ncbi:MAG: integrase/recombinase XerD [Actinomycetota bacterium]|nr:integrase/recombinase XerD [Actinomycetota bacterium]
MVLAGRCDNVAGVGPVERYLASLSSLERPPNTVKAYAHDLKDWFVVLDRRGLDWRVVQVEDVAAFVAWLGLPPLARDGRVRVLFAALLDTGIRVGEALGLRHEDLSIAERQPAVIPRENDNRARATRRGRGNCPVVAGGESEVGGILAKAKVSVSASLSKSNATTTTNQATIEIPAGKYGSLQYVSWGKDITWSKVRTNANCSTTTLLSGRIKFPTKSEGWYKSITSS